MDDVRIFFNSSVCHTCKKPSAGGVAKYCQGCKVVSYCCKDHQAQDWKNHKALCKIITTESNYLKYNVKNHADLQIYKQQRGLLWQLKLGRKLTKSESQMFMFPRVCGVCFKQDPLICCLECLCEFYCSKNHQELHNKFHKQFCPELKLILDMDCYFFHNDPDLNACSIKQAPGDIVSITNGIKFIEHVLKHNIEINRLNYLYCCDQILSGLTILFGLEQAGLFLNCKLPKHSLEIHIVGATAFEQNLHWAWIIEIFFHWIKNLEEIHFVFIGPDAGKFSFSFQNLKHEFCPECRARQNLSIREANIYESFYHEVIKNIPKPDVVVAFNSGLHEFHKSDTDTWKQSLSSLLHNHEVPLILTAYTLDEIKQDLQMLKETVKIKMIYGPVKNPFSNVRPLQDWATENIPIYFVNNFLAVVQQDNSL